MKRLLCCCHERTSGDIRSDWSTFCQKGGRKEQWKTGNFRCHSTNSKCPKQRHDGKGDFSVFLFETNFPFVVFRRSLAARRRATNALDFDDFDEKENSLDETTNGRRTSRLLNGSFSAPDEPIQTPRQLVDLYQKTVELATQGKINIKNAFSIPLVERLPQILHVIALDDEENHHLGPNFVKAGSVIDTR